MRALTHLGTKVLRTPRLVLRPYCLTDAQAVFDGWMGVDHICEMLNLLY